jgi:hypothetical protein
MVLDKFGEAAAAKAVLDVQDLLHNLTMTTFLQVAVCPDLFGIDVPTFAKAFDEANHVSLAAEAAPHTCNPYGSCRPVESHMN